MRKSEWFLIAIVIVFFATGAAFYPYLPAELATHWDAAGQVNGMMSRAWGVFLLPIIFVLIALIFTAIPRIDPRRDNIAKFRRYYDYFLVALAIVFYYIYLLTLFRNLGYQFDPIAAIFPAVAGLIYISGMMLPHTHRNFFIGVRTPWTLSSDTVWQKTNQAGGWVFRGCGIIILVGAFVPAPAALWFLIVPILTAAIGLIIYSYVLFEKERK